MLAPDVYAARQRVFSVVPKERRVDAITAVSSVKLIKWKPNPDHADGTPNTQRLALESKADILGLSGTAGWGKTDLALGIAALHHTHSVIFRRIFKNLRGIIERSREIYNPEGDKASLDRYNESLHRWILSNNRMIEFEAMQYENDKFNQRGRPRDLYVFDEATEFTRTQIEFSLGWMRTTKEGQRCRAILPFNPPTDSQGLWVIDYFLPWIAYLFPNKFTHPNPAKPGELRWYTTIDGEEVERSNGDSFEHNGKTYKPLSRSFLFGTLQDNPYLRDTNYTSILAGMPEPLRSQLLYGDFAADSKADPWQVIPTSWIKEAQRRWMERVEPDMPVSGVGVDVARGGKDSLAISLRKGTYFNEPIEVPGVNVEDGPAAAGELHDALKHVANIGYINIDVAGIGSSAYDSIKSIPKYSHIVKPINASNRSDYIVYSTAVRGSNKREALFSMYNKRAEYHWRLREALDPANDSEVALPPGNNIVADLGAAKFQYMAGGGKNRPPKIKIEEKEEIKKRLGHSPDVGEAIMLANLQEGSKQRPGSVSYA